MIEYPGFQFAAAPLTGSEWFVRACDLAIFGGDRVSAYGMAGEPFPDTPGPLRVSLTRHPCSWLQEQFPLGRGFGYGDSLEAFVNTYYRELGSGYISRRMLSYQADSYIRFEDIPEAFVQFARSLGVEDRVLTAQYFHTKPARCTADRAAWPIALWQRVIDAERELCEAFDYW